MAENGMIDEVYLKATFEADQALKELENYQARTEKAFTSIQKTAERSSEAVVTALEAINEQVAKSSESMEKATATLKQLMPKNAFRGWQSFFGKDKGSEVDGDVSELTATVKNLSDAIDGFIRSFTEKQVTPEQGINAPEQTQGIDNTERPDPPETGPLQPPDNPTKDDKKRNETRLTPKERKFLKPIEGISGSLIAVKDILTQILSVAGVGLTASSIISGAGNQAERIIALNARAAEMGMQPDEALGMRIAAKNMGLLDENAFMNLTGTLFKASADLKLGQFSPVFDMMAKKGLDFTRIDHLFQSNAQNKEFLAIMDLVDQIRSLGDSFDDVDWSQLAAVMPGLTGDIKKLVQNEDVNFNDEFYKAFLEAREVLTGDDRKAAEGLYKSGLERDKKLDKFLTKMMTVAAPRIEKLNSFVGGILDKFSGNKNNMGTLISGAAAISGGVALKLTLSKLLGSTVGGIFGGPPGIVIGTILADAIGASLTGESFLANLYDKLSGVQIMDTANNVAEWLCDKLEQAIMAIFNGVKIGIINVSDTITEYITGILTYFNKKIQAITDKIKSYFLDPTRQGLDPEEAVENAENKGSTLSHTDDPISNESDENDGRSDVSIRNVLTPQEERPENLWNYRKFWVGGRDMSFIEDYKALSDPPDPVQSLDESAARAKEEANKKPTEIHVNMTNNYNGDVTKQNVEQTRDNTVRIFTGLFENTLVDYSNGPIHSGS